MSRHWLAWCGVIVLLGAGVAIAERPWASLRDRLAAGTFACEPRNEPTSAVTVQSPPTTYDALCDRNVYPYPRLPSLGGAGFQFTDPTFASRMVRVTDGETRPDTVGRAWFSPSSAETTAWNTNSTRFYVVGGGGEQLVFDFDPATMRASRLGKGKGAGGLVLGFAGEPTFSFVDPDVLYGGHGTRLVASRGSPGAQTAPHHARSRLPGVGGRPPNACGPKGGPRRAVDAAAGAPTG